jgi:hypothetical protein
MSEYFRVLKRIEQNRREGDSSNADPGATKRAATQPEPTPPSLRLVPKAAQPTTGAAAQTAAAFRTLFDNIRVLADAPTPTLVFVGASGAEPVRMVTTGLAAHIERLGLEVLLAEIKDWNGRPILRRRADDAIDISNSGDPAHLDLGAPAAQVQLTDWLDGAARMADVILIEARPLTESIDAALLARACAGLVIVAQNEVTHRDALHATAERARGAGCRTLGVVTCGTRNRVPEWLRRLLSRPRRQPQVNSEGLT